MEEFTNQDLIEELQDYYGPPTPDRREGGITILEWAEIQNISDKKATKQLNRKVDEGKMVREWMRLGPHARGWVYYKK